MRLVVTKADTIYRGDNMSNCITFLLPVRINGVDMETATVFLSYIRADGEPDMVILNRTPEKYNNTYYQYVMPVTCKLSRYPGQICMWLQICDGCSEKPIVAKTGECTIKIHESKSMDNYLCDHQLTAMYQLKKELEKISSDSDDDNTWEDMDSPADDDLGGEYWEDM